MNQTMFRSPSWSPEWIPTQRKGPLSCGILHSMFKRENVDVRASHHPLPITPKAREIISDRAKQVNQVSRVTFQWSRMPLGKLSGRVLGKQRSQRSLSTSEHSRNTEKTPFADS
ncbi:hypothetical protein CRG98_007360 [Punica granatum]|uniref:Uncharacterized protein n=1 Tax=Punica granatum TaxID=22663 RepID=A0A2I0KWP6_PUNGR|nr:hypothetical protein CRG98_007360 [Punica granatum]